MRVKVFIIVSILALILCSCTQSDISTVQIIEDGNYTIELKKFTILNNEYDFNIVNYNDIDYINANDAYEIISLIAKQTNKYKLDSGIVSDVFDCDNNRINIELTKVISPARAIFSQKPNNFKISGLEDFTNYRIETTSLNDFNINYISVNNTIYLPLMILNYSVLDNEYMLYPAPNKKSFTLDEISTFSGNEEFITSIDSSGEKILNESLALRKFSANYLYEFIKRNYPYISMRHHNLLNLDLASINTNDDYIRYIFESLDTLDDGHTCPRIFISPEIDVRPLMNNSNRVKRTSDYMKAIETNLDFTSSDYKIISDNLGYIRIHSFLNDNDIFHKLPYIFKELQNTDGLIIDLRFNLGGITTNIFNLLDPLVKNNNSVQVYFNQMVNGDLTDIKKFEFTKTGNFYYEKPIVLLTNRFTYSAGNIFAGLFKDNKLGTIIGEKTLGGGSSRIINVLPDGSSFYFSNPDAILYNRNGEFFETGIEPDIKVKENLENNKDQILEKAIEYLSH